ncbi:MAG: hypothetical protein JOY69_07100 [Candidatus Eremiobacteraeota bacterium]|nr:hypothetical protein [Candidatus Eremiobacteraeota bacterium]
MKRAIRIVGMVVGAAVTASCGQPYSPGLPNGTPSGLGYSAVPFGCYVTKVDPTTVNATITFYGWPDNSPPGNQIAHPVIHKVAAGDGTYCNPTTFATERSNNDRIPYGIKIYVPFLKQYFVREDDCAHSGPRRGHGHNGCSGIWFDLWIGGDKNSKAHAVIWCENHLTPNSKVQVSLYPQSGLPVANAGAIYQDNPPPLGTCDGVPEKSQASTFTTILPN